MNTSRTEKTIKELFIGNCWEYLYQNFHKFSETNRIKIALELCKKDIPQEVVGNGTNVNVFPTKTIIFRDIDEPTDRNIHEPESAEGSRIEGKV